MNQTTKKTEQVINKIVRWLLKKAPILKLNQRYVDCKILMIKIEINDAKAAPLMPRRGINIKLVITVNTPRRSNEKSIKGYFFENAIASIFNPKDRSNHLAMAIKITTINPSL
jgi:hypothetical protein